MAVATIVSNTAGLDSNYYQNGLPAALDTSADGDITWTEWIVGHTAANETYTQFLDTLDGAYSITFADWDSAEDEFTMRDIDGDLVISWPEYWVS